MKLHVDSRAFDHKPQGAEIGGIKARFSKLDSIRDLNAGQILDALRVGYTIQPGVTPFSEKSRAEGNTGTVDADFEEQTAFFADMDNKRDDIPHETPEHAALVLTEYDLSITFMYRSFNDSGTRQKFRVGVVCDEPITDRAERDRIQQALISAFPQADTDCINADRIFFGTDKGIIAQFCNPAATCSKAELLAFADKVLGGEYQSGADSSLSGAHTVPESKKGITPPKPALDVIPVGRRNNTLSRLAGRVLKRYGDADGRAHRAFMEEAAKCAPPLDSKELSTIWNSALLFYHKTVQADPKYIPPADYAAADFAASLKPADLTDVGEALILAREYGDRLRHSPATNYLVYSGQVWEENAARARGSLHELTERQLAENTPAFIIAAKALERAEQTLQAAKQGGSDADRQNAAKAHADAKKNSTPVMAYQSFILKHRNSKDISGVMKEAQTPLEINVAALDANGLTLNTPGGEVDLRTGVIKPHRPESYHTKITAVAPSGEGADVWRDFINVITCNRPALADYMQLTSGAELIGRVYMEILIIAYGGGRNGKSTYYNTKARVLGDYAGQISAETLTTGRKNGKNWELAELRGKRLIVAPELEEGTRLDASFVKKICSTDKILGEQKYKTPFTFEPSHTTVLYTNHLPRIGSTDAGTWRRIIVLPFDAVIEGQADIKNYADYLFRHAGGAALAWAIEGAKRFIKAGYRIEPPECVKAAVERYRDQNDWLNNFLTECCEVDPKYREKSGELYAKYREHCVQTGEYIRSAQDFKAAIEGAGYETRRIAAGVFVHGLRIECQFLRGA